MGDVYRILYVHVPSAWVALLAFAINFGSSVYHLSRPSLRADALAEASAEVGLVFAVLLIALGAIWGRPTWGVYWTWDPRLTTAAVLVLAYAGYLALRRFFDDPERRATWSAVTAVLIFVDVPVVWFSVRWWRSLHQVQSSSATMAQPVIAGLAINFCAFLVLAVAFLRLRYVLARRRQRLELGPPPPAVPAGGPT